MKIYLPLPQNREAKTGKGHFFDRLANALKDSSIEVVSDPNMKVDIAVHNISIKENHVNAKFNILRVDGVYHDKKINYKKINQDIFETFHAIPNGIIYQSEYSKAMVDKYIGKFNGKTTIILNGADPSFYRNLEPINSKYPNQFISASRWRPHKRLRDIIQTFIMAQIDGSCLYIAGDLKDSGINKKDIDKYFLCPNIFYLGVLNQNELGRYLISCKAFLHLCWLDSCPNSVVESICAGLPVITNNVGGSKELVSPSGGIVLDIDSPYDLSPCDLYNPPKIDNEKVINAMNFVLGNKMDISSEHVDIYNIAKQYINFFEEIYYS